MLRFVKCNVQQTVSLFKQTKRYKGHSKWQNIKHTKGAIDAERAFLYNQYSKRMRVAVAEGKSTKPSINLKLAHIIEEAKKKNVPIATINGMLDKIENSKMNSQSEIVDFRGPSSSHFVVRVLCDNIKAIKMTFNSLFKKHSCVASEGKSSSAFNHVGFVLTEIEVDLDTATSDAIIAGAEEVEEVEEDRKLLRFVCDPSNLPKVTNQLKNLNYKIITSDEEFIPKMTVSLSDKDLKTIYNLFDKLNSLEEVISIFHNIDIPQSEEEMKMNAKR